MTRELFVSLDVETIGPIPGKNPMIELGAAAFNIEGEVVSTWDRAIDQSHWESDPETLAWWHGKSNRPILESLQARGQVPEVSMFSFHHWLNGLPGQLTPVAYPAAFDYMFVYWYLMYYVGDARPFSFSCLDIKTYVMAAMKNTAFRKTTKKSFPREWFHPGLKHTHNALDDALEQGWMFVQAHRANLGLPLLEQQ